MADGILMEAWSVEDGGESIQFCVYVYNVQPGLQFNYKTGRSQYSGIFFDTSSESVVTTGIQLKKYGLDLNTYTVHSLNCSEYKNLNANEKAKFSGDVSMKLAGAGLYTLSALLGISVSPDPSIFNISVFLRHC